MPHDVVVRQDPRRGSADLVVRAQRRRDHGAQRRRRPRGGEEGEVERLVHLVRADVAREARERLDPRLGDEGAVAVVPGEDAVPRTVDLVDALLVEHRAGVAGARGPVLGRARVGLLLGGALHHGHGAVPVGQAVGLDHAVRDVDAEPVHALVEPEAQDLLELLADLRVVPREVGLGRVEQVQVPLAGGLVLGAGDGAGARARGHAGPRGAAEDRLPVVRGQLAVLALTLAEHVASALGRALGRGQRGLEPRVLVGRVVRHEVDDHADAAGVGLGEQLVEVGERAEQRVDVAVVGDVVAGVLLGRAVERAQPHRVDPELGEVVELRRDAGQVADAVAVAVREGAGVDLVDHGVAPPLGRLAGAGVHERPGAEGCGRGGRRGGAGGRHRIDTSHRAVGPHVRGVGVLQGDHSAGGAG